MKKTLIILFMIFLLVGCSNSSSCLDGKNGQDGKNGIDGKDGLSAYEIYLKYNLDYSGTEEEWTNMMFPSKTGGNYSKPVISADGKYVYFGTYPQTKASKYIAYEIEKNTRINNSGEYEYYGNRYVKLNGEYFLVEPIKWRILDAKDGKILILSELILDAHIYDDDSNNYKESVIRAWLNSEFLNKAFTNKSLIVTTAVDNSVESTYDKVFLLSNNEVDAFLGVGYIGSEEKNPAGQCQLTDFAFEKGAYMKMNRDFYGYGRYLLRSPAYAKNSVYVVDYTGGLFKLSVDSALGTMESSSTNKYFGVRPACWINLGE